MYRLSVLFLLFFNYSNLYSVNLQADAKISESSHEQTDKTTSRKTEESSGFEFDKPGYRSSDSIETQSVQGAGSDVCVKVKSATVSAKSKMRATDREVIEAKLAEYGIEPFTMADSESCKLKSSIAAAYDQKIKAEQRHKFKLILQKYKSIDPSFRVSTKASIMKAIFQLERMNERTKAAMAVMNGVKIRLNNTANLKEPKAADLVTKRQKVVVKLNPDFVQNEKAGLKRYVVFSTKNPIVKVANPEFKPSAGIKKIHPDLKRFIIDARYNIIKILVKNGRLDLSRFQYVNPLMNRFASHSMSPEVAGQAIVKAGTFLLHEGWPLVVECLKKIAGFGLVMAYVKNHESKVDEQQKVNTQLNNSVQYALPGNTALTLRPDYGYQVRGNERYFNRHYLPHEIKKMREAGITDPILTIQDGIERIDLIEYSSYGNSIFPLPIHIFLNQFGNIYIPVKNEMYFDHHYTPIEIERLRQEGMKAAILTTNRYGQECVDVAQYDAQGNIIVVKVSQTFDRKKETNKDQKSKVAGVSGGAPMPPDPNDPNGWKNRNNNAERKENKITKKEFFEKTKTDYEYWRDGIYKKKSRANGIEGAEYLQWDHLHNDVEAYNHSMTHLGSIDPQTMKLYKPPVKHRKINK